MDLEIIRICINHIQDSGKTTKEMEQELNSIKTNQKNIQAHLLIINIMGKASLLQSSMLMKDNLRMDYLVVMAKLNILMGRISQELSKTDRKKQEDIHIQMEAITMECSNKIFQMAQGSFTGLMA